jgi:LysM repeat protein
MLRILGIDSAAANSALPRGTGVISTADISPGQAWADALAQATTNSPQDSVTVKRGDTLTGIARSRHYALSSLEAANSQIVNPDLIYAGQTVYLPKTTPAQVVTGVDNLQIQPIIAAMADANAADRSLEDLRHSGVRNRGILGDTQEQSAQSWGTVEQTTYTMLLNNNSGAYPELTAAAEVQQLNALEPGNSRFAEANNAALTTAVQYWSRIGVTKSALSPIIGAYNVVTQAANAPDEQEANGQLNAAIGKSLTDAANQAGTDPKARSQAMTERAAIIQLAGPQDPAFQTAVDNANYDLQVIKPAQAVADAYAKGGAPAAANALKTATQNAGNAYYAGQIIQASQGTINQIAAYLGSQASNEPLNRSPLGPTDAQKAFYRIYADLSQSVEAANTLTISSGSNGQVSLSLSPGGKAAADLVANSLARNAPKNLRTWQNWLYGNAATNAITGGDGAALTLTTAAALKQKGNSGLAYYFIEGAASGIQGDVPDEGLASKTKSDVSAFAATTETLNKLRATWGAFMTGSQLANATNGYLAAHPNVGPKANAQLAVIAQDGDAIAEAEAAWHSYSGQLGGIDGQQDLTAAAQSLTGTSTSAAFAVSQSTNVNNALAAALGSPAPSRGGGAGSVAQALMASPMWSLPKSSRSFINALYKTLNAQAKGAKAPLPYGQGTFTTLSLIGLALTAETALAKGFPDATAQELSSSFYTALGFPKYTGEVISGLAKNTIVQDFVKNNPAFELDTAGKSPVLSLNLPNGSTIDLSNLTKTGWFKALGSAYYGAGALASVLEAEDSISNGDNVGAGLDSLEALGNFLNAAKPLFEEVFGETIAEGLGAAGSGIGLIAAAGILIYQVIESARATEAYQADSSRFLQQGLGLNPALADALSAPSGHDDGSSASAALQAYAKAYHIPYAQLLQKLNQEPIDKATEFINEAANMQAQSNGQYAASLPSDDPKMVGTHPVTRAAGRGPVYPVHVNYQANSLQQLHYWADYLFGKDLPG